MTCFSALAADGAYDRAQFAEPPADAAPWLRWWWPGGEVDAGELERELDVIDAAGFAGVEVQSFAVGLPQSPADRGAGYGSPAFYAGLRAAADKAYSLGMKLDLSLGSAWPPAAAGTQDSLQHLLTASRVIDAQGLTTVTVPPPEQPLSYQLASELLGLDSEYDANALRRVAVVVARLADDQSAALAPTRATVEGLPDLAPTQFLDAAAMVDVTAFVDGNDRFDWDASGGTWIVFAFYAGPTGTEPFYSAAAGQQRVIDPLSSTATPRLLDDLAGAARDALGERFGDTVTSLFVDSLEFRTELFWNDEFNDQFAARRGYRLERFLPLLWRPFAHDSYLIKVYPDAPPAYDAAGIGAKVRSDYQRTLSELMLEHFFAAVRDWTGRAGTRSRIQAHGAPADLLDAYALADVPETEGLYAEGATSFLRLAASAAHLEGRKIVSSEVFAFEKPFAETAESYVRSINSQFVAGINQLVFHGFPYRADLGNGDGYWMPFDSSYLPPNFPRFGTKLDDLHPLWGFMPDLVDYARRAQWWLREGDAVAKVAVFRPFVGFADDLGAVSPAVLQLEAGGYTYDYINGHYLAGVAEIEGQSLVINGNRYDALVVDDVDALPVSDAESIHAIALAGVPVVFAHDVPAVSDGLAGVPGTDFTVRALMENVFGGRTRAEVVAAPQFAAGSALFVSDQVPLDAALGNQLGVQPAVDLGAARGKVQLHHRRHGESDYYFLANLSGTRQQFVARFGEAGDRTPDIWDLWRGEVHQAPIYSNEGTTVAMPVELEPGAAIAIGFEEAKASYHVAYTDQPMSFDRDGDNAVIATADKPGTYQITLSDGTVRKVVIPDSGLSNISLPLWDIDLRWQGANGWQSQSASRALLGDLNSRSYKPTPGIAEYTAYFSVTDEYVRHGIELTLDLGRVGDAAVVLVNDQVVGRYLAPPFRPSITDYVKSGVNEVKVITATHAGSPSGLIGPVRIIPRYTFTVARPLPFAVAVTPAGFPDHTPAKMNEAIGIAGLVTKQANFQWFWRTPPSSAQPEGGRTVDCNAVAPWVVESRQLGLGVTLQFQSLYTFITAESGRPTVRVASPVAPFDTASFSMPEVRRAYLEQIACLAAYQPDYLVLGPEVNFAVTFNYEEYLHFSDVYTDAYALVKRISPYTKVGLSWQYDGLRNSYPLDPWSYVPGAGPQDFIGLTSYFGFSAERASEYPTADSVPADYYHPIRERFAAEVPVVFTEFGWSSAFEAGEKNQAAFIDRLPELLSEIAPDYIIWGLLHDVDYFEGPGQSLNQSGLLNADGTIKRSWEQVSRMRVTGALSDMAEQSALQSIPFGVTVVPENFPQQRTLAGDLEAVAEAAEVGRHISLQFPWYDEVTKEHWGCDRIGAMVAEAQRLGLDVTLQLNTYVARPAGADQVPRMLLLTPLAPPDGNGQSSASFADAEIRAAFLERVSCLAAMQVDYLVIAPEINFLQALAPIDYALFVEVYREAYERVKAVAPTTRVGVSYQYGILRDDFLAGTSPDWWRDLGPQDFVGLTTYFHYSEAVVAQYPSPLDIPNDFYAPVRRIFGEEIPILFTEVGFSTFFPGGRENQWLFINRLPMLMARVRPAHVIWGMQHSVDGYFTDEIEPLNHSGLLLQDGTETASWAQVKRLRAMRILTDPE